MSGNRFKLFVGFLSVGAGSFVGATRSKCFEQTSTPSRAITPVKAIKKETHPDTLFWKAEEKAGDGKFQEAMQLLGQIKGRGGEILDIQADTLEAQCLLGLKEPSFAQEKIKQKKQRCADYLKNEFHFEELSYEHSANDQGARFFSACAQRQHVEEVVQSHLTPAL